jgi:hypothetical protein
MWCGRLDSTNGNSLFWQGSGFGGSELAQACVRDKDSVCLHRDNMKLSPQGWSRDLSDSGLRAFVAEPLIPGESVMLEIPLPDLDKHVIPAKVVRALGTEYGFQFTTLSNANRFGRR